MFGIPSVNFSEARSCHIHITAMGEIDRQLVLVGRAGELEQRVGPRGQELTHQERERREEESDTGGRDLEH